MEVMSPAVTSMLSDSVQTGVFVHGVANVIVTEVRAVPATAIVPELSFEGLTIDDVPPDTDGCGPPVTICPFTSIINVVEAVDEPTARFPEKVEVAVDELSLNWFEIVVEAAAVTMFDVPD